ncbi:MAG TPA: hypothetical protein VNI20_07525, partial [Fimbriimonadaceae bacterium]|nr:hypothetical protein [Fimbriimonadaceae bacterium]
MILAALVLTSALRIDYPADLRIAYDVTRAFRTLDGEEETIYGEKWVYTFDSPLAGGAARLKREVTLNKITVDGTETSPKPVAVQNTEDHSPRGDVRGQEFSGQPDATLLARLARIGVVVYPAEPISVGETWTRQTEPTDAVGLSGATWVYTPTTDQDGKITGTFNFHEDGVSDAIQAQGEFVVSASDGWPVS